MIAVTVRRILTLLALIAPAAGRAADPEVGSVAPDAVVFRHYL